MHTLSFRFKCCYALYDNTFVVWDFRVRVQLLKRENVAITSELYCELCYLCIFKYKNSEYNLKQVYELHGAFKVCSL